MAVPEETRTWVKQGRESGATRQRACKGNAKTPKIAGLKRCFALYLQTSASHRKCATTKNQLFRRGGRGCL